LPADDAQQRLTALLGDLPKRHRSPAGRLLRREARAKAPSSSAGLSS